jgi:ribosomal protein S7
MADTMKKVKGIVESINEKIPNKVKQEELSRFEKAMETVAPFVKKTKPTEVQIAEYNLSE